MAAHHPGKRRLIAVGGEGVEEFGVGEVVHHPIIRRGAENRQKKFERGRGKGTKKPRIARDRG